MSVKAWKKKEKRRRQIAQKQHEARKRKKRDEVVRALDPCSCVRQNFLPTVTTVFEHVYCEHGKML